MNTVIRQALKEMGADSNSIAAFLEDAGITGDMVRTETCPVACYLKKKFSLSFVSAGLENVHFATGASPGGYPSGYTPTPAAVQQFIRWFDRGDYPHLITKH